MIIKSRFKIKEYEYISDETPLLQGTANKTTGFIRQKIYASYGDDKIVIEQKNFLLKFLNSLPLLNAVNFTPFKCYINGRLCGKAKRKFFGTTINIEFDNDTYILSLHTGDSISLKKNGTEIAAYSKAPYSEKEEHNYNVYSSETAGLALLLTFAFCILADISFYRLSGLEFKSGKYEKTFVLGQRKK